MSLDYITRGMRSIELDHTVLKDLRKMPIEDEYTIDRSHWHRPE